ncbi:conserved unknown protein [Ectocarpus siliculosus]|uniref:Uncharacterized protein n=1 Tax=Ectocarpus siliculosus TaxID=2880 RepID=D8LTZ9_ECTSI|nr:conserved unknown protein [Ectocarpus siliculosus]|eukprot:CBN75389.1 conserved unknown protein [Ectocarpus siliculosus]
MAAQIDKEENAIVSVSVLNGKVDPLKWGTKVYVEVRLGDLHVQRLSPVSVDPVTGDFSYESATGNITVFNSNILEEIFDETLHIVLRSWHPTSNWVDSAKILISVRSISIDSTVRPTGVDMGDESGEADRDFMVFRLEPVPGGDSFQTADESVPNLVLSATLRSPFRPPVESVARLLQGCASTVDLALDTVSLQTERVAPYLTSQAALVPTIPAGIVVLASLPLLCVLGVAGLPLLVPMLIVVAAVGGVGALLTAAVWLFSRGGRAWVQRAVRPVYDRVGRDNPEVLYPVGPGPSPARIAQCLVPTGMWSKLAMSIAVDTIGCTSYIVPILGESADLLWAPVSYLLIDAMYHGSSPWAGVFGAMEELLPFTDIIPTATLAWMKEYLPQMLQGLSAADQNRQEQHVYHSDDNVGPGGVHFPSQPDGVR